MQYVLLAGGPGENVPPLEEVKVRYKNARWIGIDRGAYVLLKSGIIPLKAFGDFDSLSVEEKEWVHGQDVHLSVFPTEKDATDTELAIEWALSQKPKRIILLGGTGGRLDHLLVNIQLIQKGLDQGIEIIIEDRWNRLTIHKPGEYVIEKSPYRYVSFIPMSFTVEGVTLKGFRYPLTDQRLTQASSLSISNELIDKKGSYSFSSGIMIVVESVDKS